MTKRATPIIAIVAAAQLARRSTPGTWDSAVATAANRQSDFIFISPTILPAGRLAFEPRVGPLAGRW